jgi:hypothetical protein
MTRLVQGFLLLAALVAILASFQLIPAQQQAFGRSQGAVVVFGEALVFSCLVAIRENHVTKPWLTVPLLCAALSVGLFTLAYIQLPSSRVARFVGRVAEQEKALANYRSLHGQHAACPPLEAELRARTLEAEAARIRYADIYAYSSPFEAKVTAAGGIAAAALALVPLAIRRTSPPT